MVRSGEKECFLFFHAIFSLFLASRTRSIFPGYRSKHLRYSYPRHPKSSRHAGPVHPEPRAHLLVEPGSHVFKLSLWPHIEVTDIHAARGGSSMRQLLPEVTSMGGGNSVSEHLSLWSGRGGMSHHLLVPQCVAPPVKLCFSELSTPCTV